jgi:hypothetical protein
MKQPHDLQIACQLLTRDIAKINLLTTDKGYDWEHLSYRLNPKTAIVTAPVHIPSQM